ncbi:unnamed protein product [Amoebophrya sp. A25]|nr:unnamed protein product [Amoebophrya sp. A25]|eukprot:GSA25T00024711001.1
MTNVAAEATSGGPEAKEDGSDPLASGSGASDDNGGSGGAGSGSEGSDASGAGDFLARMEAAAAAEEQRMKVEEEAAAPRPPTPEELPKVPPPKLSALQRGLVRTFPPRYLVHLGLVPKEYWTAQGIDLRDESEKFRDRMDPDEHAYMDYTVGDPVLVFKPSKPKPDKQDVKPEQEQVEEVLIIPEDAAKLARTDGTVPNQTSAGNAISPISHSDNNSGQVMKTTGSSWANLKMNYASLVPKREGGGNLTPRKNTPVPLSTLSVNGVLKQGRWIKGRVIEERGQHQLLIALGHRRIEPRPSARRHQRVADGNLKLIERYSRYLRPRDETGSVEERCEDDPAIRQKWRLACHGVGYDEEEREKDRGGVVLSRWLRQKALLSGGGDADETGEHDDEWEEDDLDETGAPPTMAATRTRGVMEVRARGEEFSVALPQNVFAPAVVFSKQAVEEKNAQMYQGRRQGSDGAKGAVVSTAQQAATHLQMAGKNDAAVSTKLQALAVEAFSSTKATEDTVLNLLPANQRHSFSHVVALHRKELRDLARERRGQKFAQELEAKKAAAAAAEPPKVLSIGDAADPNAEGEEGADGTAEDAPPGEGAAPKAAPEQSGEVRPATDQGPHPVADGVAAPKADNENGEAPATQLAVVGGDQQQTSSTALAVLGESRGSDSQRQQAVTEQQMQVLKKRGRSLRSGSVKLATDGAPTQLESIGEEKVVYAHFKVEPTEITLTQEATEFRDYVVDVSKKVADVTGSATKLTLRTSSRIALDMTRSSAKAAREATRTKLPEANNAEPAVEVQGITDFVHPIFTKKDDSEDEGDEEMAQMLGVTEDDMGKLPPLNCLDTRIVTKPEPDKAWFDRYSESFRYDARVQFRDDKWAREHKLGYRPPVGEYHLSQLDGQPQNEEEENVVEQLKHVERANGLRFNENQHTEMRFDYDKMMWFASPKKKELKPLEIPKEYLVITGKAKPSEEIKLA